MVKNWPEMQEQQETQFLSLGWDDPLEEKMATLSSILSWKIPCTEEPGGLQSMGSQRVGWLTNPHKELKWLSTPYIYVYIYITHTHIEQNIEQKSLTHSIFNVLDFISSWTFIQRSCNRNLKTNRRFVCWRKTHLETPSGPPAWWAPPPPFSSSPFHLTLSSLPSVSSNSQKTSNYSSYTLMKSSATCNSSFYQ